MADPFEALRMPITPLAPDPAFAARLRARVARALTPETPEAEPASPSIPLTPTGVVPYLAVSDSRRAIEWYQVALGARRRGEPIVMPDGRVGHAEMELAGGVFYLADDSPASHHASPRPGADSTVSLSVNLPDVDAVFDRAVSRGATPERALEDTPYGRMGALRDPFGHRWLLSASVPQTIRQGDIGYVSLWVPDVDRAAAFFGSVLGWSYLPASTDQGRRVAGAKPDHGMFGGQERSTLFLCYAVDHLDEALERVQRAGGAVEAPTDAPYGRIANCFDDQGVPFALYQPPPGRPEPRPPANGDWHGDLSYITMEVRDSAKARAFYATVLGWRFTPGRVDDGWNADAVVTMTGMHGGHIEATTVPMYRVDDIDAAITRVRAAGGSSTDADRQPYGLTAECADDQGTRFFLHQP